MIKLLEQVIYMYLHALYALQAVITIIIIQPQITCHCMIELLWQLIQFACNNYYNTVKQYDKSWQFQQSVYYVFS